MLYFLCIYLKLALALLLINVFSVLMTVCLFLFVFNKDF